MARRRPFAVLACVLFALLFHELLLRWAANLLHAPPAVVTGLSLWKDGALLGIAAAWGWKRWAGRKQIPGAATRARRHPIELLRRHPIELAFGAAVAIGVVRILVAPDRLAAVFAFRDYYEPVIVLFLARDFLPTREQLRRTLTWWLVALAIVGLVGVWQTFFWSATDYLRWGFGPAISDLGVPPLALGGRDILRGPSTLSGPNELGMHLALGMLGLAQLSFTAGKGQRWAFAALGTWYGVALAITYSRGDILAFPIGLAVIYLARSARRQPIGLPALGVHAVMMAGLLLATVRSGLWGFMTDTAGNLEADYHIQDSAEALAFLAENPGGVPLGQVGPRIGAFFPAPGQVAFHIEGSIFQIAFELGIPGLVVWAVFLSLSLWRGWRAWRSAGAPEVEFAAAVAVAGWIGSLVVFLFIPLMQSLTIMAWMWFFLGLALSSSRLEAGWQGAAEVPGQATS